MPSGNGGAAPVSAELVLSYLRADAAMRAMYRTTMPQVFDAELTAAIDEADAAIAEAGDVAADALSTGAGVFDEIGGPTTANPGAPGADGDDPAQGGSRDPRVMARRMFEASLARLIAEQYEEGDDDEDADGIGADDMPATNEEKLFTVLPTVCELAGGESSARLVRVSRLFRQSIVHGKEANAVWIGIAMREHGPAARAHLAEAGVDATLSTDWRAFVLDQLRRQKASEASPDDQPARGD